MMIKVFPHGKGNGIGPTRYLVRQDYHGRKEHPPVVLRGDPDMTRRLIDSIDREWKFTAGVCSCFTRKRTGGDGRFRGCRVRRDAG